MTMGLTFQEAVIQAEWLRVNGHDIKVPTRQTQASSCWIDRIEWLRSVLAEGDSDDGTIEEAIAEANRYA